MRPVTPILGESAKRTKKASKELVPDAAPAKPEAAKSPRKSTKVSSPEAIPEIVVPTAKVAAAIAAISERLRVYSENAQRATDALSGIEPPKDIGTAADMLLMLRAAKSFATDLGKAVEAVESMARNYLVDNVPKSSQTGAVGKLACARVVLKQVPRVSDWDATFSYIAKEKAFDLLQRRLSDKAVVERWENGKQIPGVEPFGALSVSITKLKT